MSLFDIRQYDDEPFDDYLDRFDAYFSYVWSCGNRYSDWELRCAICDNMNVESRNLANHMSHGTVFYMNCEEFWSFIGFMNLQCREASRQASLSSIKDDLRELIASFERSAMSNIHENMPTHFSCNHISTYAAESYNLNDNNLFVDDDEHVPNCIITGFSNPCSANVEFYDEIAGVDKIAEPSEITPLGKDDSKEDKHSDQIDIINLSVLSNEFFLEPLVPDSPDYALYLEVSEGESWEAQVDEIEAALRGTVLCSPMLVAGLGEIEAFTEKPPYAVFDSEKHSAPPTANMRLFYDPAIAGSPKTRWPNPLADVDVYIWRPRPHNIVKGQYSGQPPGDWPGIFLKFDE